ncbi:MAG TPA: DUF4333 domain-containing protein [Amycolatopsis sp.]|nr:DUF4333 domain-containing protein [Amycolatopsis sp.]
MKLPAFLLVAGAVLALGGCSVTVQKTDNSISKETLEQGIADTLQKKVGDRPDTVTCPGSLKPEPGASIRCELTAVGLRYGVTATVTSAENGKANYDVKVDNQPLGKA